MARPRKRAYQKLPQYVYINRGRYIYRPPKTRETVLGKADKMTLPAVWARYRELTETREDTLQWLVDQYKQGKGERSYAALKRQGDTDTRLEIFLSAPVGDGELRTRRYADITPGVIRQFLDWCGAEKSPFAANSARAAISSAWSWCYERDIVRVPNPCLGVKRLPEPKRTHLVSATEYLAVYKAAPKYMQVAMELAYLCRMRVSEVLDTRYKDMTDDGLDTRRLKGSKDAITEWTPRLKDICEYGLEGCLRVPEMTIVNRNGRPVRFEAFTTAWQRLQVKLHNDGKLARRFRFHDLKARGVSNFKGDKVAAGGWSDPRMVEVYDRAKIKVEATE